jgi:hypothetical protein
VDLLTVATVLQRLGLVTLLLFAGLVVYALATEPGRLLADNETPMLALLAAAPFVAGWFGRMALRRLAAARAATVGNGGLLRTAG